MRPTRSCGKLGADGDTSAEKGCGKNAKRGSGNLARKNAREREREAIRRGGLQRGAVGCLPEVNLILRG